MGIKKGSFFGNVKGGFKLGKAKPKVQARFIRKKVNTSKNVKFAKKFFKKSARVQKRYIRKNACMLIHQLSGHMWGKFEEMKDDMKNSEMLMEKIKNI